MLMSNDFIEAEHKYRREVLRDDYRRDHGRKVTVGRMATLLIVASIVVAGCGTAPEATVGASEAMVKTAQIRDAAPGGSADSCNTEPTSGPHGQTSEEIARPTSGPR